MYLICFKFLWIQDEKSCPREIQLSSPNQIRTFPVSNLHLGCYLRSINNSDHQQIGDELVTYTNYFQFNRIAKSISKKCNSQRRTVIQKLNPLIFFWLNAILISNDVLNCKITLERLYFLKPVLINVTRYTTSEYYFLRQISWPSPRESEGIMEITARDVVYIQTRSAHYGLLSGVYLILFFLGCVLSMYLKLFSILLWIIYSFPLEL